MSKTTYETILLPALSQLAVLPNDTLFHLVAFSFSLVLENQLSHLFLCLKKAVAHGPQSPQALGICRKNSFKTIFLPTLFSPSQSDRSTQELRLGLKRGEVEGTEAPETRPSLLLP